MNWYVYLLECADGSIYTGITPDLIKRVKIHNVGKGAKSLKGRLPVKLVYSEQYPNRSAASMREYQIKQFSRQQKLALIGSCRVDPGYDNTTIIIK